MKRALKFILGLSIAISHISCGDSFSFGGDSTTYNCNWNEDSLNAQFYNMNLLLPCDNGDCDNSFANVNLENLLIPHSLFHVMEQISECHTGISCAFDFKWTVSIVSNKKCSPPSDQYKSVILKEDNYSSKFSCSTIDQLSGSPYVPENCFIYAHEHKHELVFTIKDVENTRDGTFGEITWKCTWFQPSNPNTLGNVWVFTCPSEGIVGAYKKNRQYMTSKYVYLNGQYQNI